MASGLYSQHVNNKKMLYLRNTIIIRCWSPGSVLPVPAVLHDRQLLRPCGRSCLLNRSVFPTSWSLDSYKAFFSFSEQRQMADQHLCGVRLPGAGQCCVRQSGRLCLCQAEVQGKNFLFNLWILIGMMIPYQVTQVPLMHPDRQQVPSVNSYAALVLPGLVTSYNIFLTKQFFSSIPTSLLEVPETLDGCSQPKIFTHIVLPLSRPFWRCCPSTPSFQLNSFFWPFLVTSKEAMYTIQVGLKQFKFANTTLFGPMMAGATISALPMFILFFCLQKYFLEGVTVGAVKG